MRGRVVGLLASSVIVVALGGCGTRDTRSDTRGTTRAEGVGARAVGSSNVASTPAGATSEVHGDAVQYFSAATLARTADALAGGARTGRTLRTAGGFQYIVMRRLTSGGPEVHDRWADVTFIQAGHGSLRSGGQVSGGSITAPGELRGGTIVGGAERTLGPGDLLLIPAGVPHQYVVARGDSLRYLTVKVAQPGAR